MILTPQSQVGNKQSQAPGNGALAARMEGGARSGPAGNPHPSSFDTAPQSVASFVAAFLEPAIAVLVYIAAALWFDEPLLRADLVLCLLVIALTFPGSNRFRGSMIAAAVDIGIGWGTLMAVLFPVGYLTHSLVYFNADMLLAWAVATPVLQFAAVWAGRTVLRAATARPEARRPAVVIGAGALGVKVASSLAIQGQNRDFAGFFDDRVADRLHPEAVAHLAGNLKDLPAFIRERGIKDVYITLPLGMQPRILELLGSLQGTTASIYFVPDVFGITIIQGRLQDMNGIPLVGICETPFTGTNELVKRISDIVLASVILVLISPVLLAVAIGVKLSSPGPVIFRQRRNGLDGEEIVVYKFRSMTTQDNGPQVAQATRHDPRITRFGAFIRKTSLDELPQFINVLQGRMSIVGPRPHAVAHNEEYRKLIRAYMVRHKVKPGITGWAQVNGLRGETDTVDKMKARVEYDLEYLRNWSLALDLQIILRTAKLMFFDRNAY